MVGGGPTAGDDGTLLSRITPIVLTYNEEPNLERTLNEARNTGKVTTLFGRVRYIPEIQNRSFTVRGNAERMATNAPIQGTAADIEIQADGKIVSAGWSDEGSPNFALVRYNADGSLEILLQKDPPAGRESNRRCETTG